jgi:mRNA interferase MazF
MALETGDIAWVEFDPVRGTEQAGRRPAIVLTSAGYHQRSGRAVVCPISSASASWAFNVPLPPGMKTYGSILVDQVRTIERAERLFDIIERAPPELISDVRGRLAALLGFEVLSSIADPGPS